MPKKPNLDWLDAMVRDTTGQKMAPRKGRKVYAPKEDIPGFCWVNIADGNLKVAAYVVHERNDDPKDVTTVRPYVRMDGSDAVPLVIGLTVRQGPEWAGDHGTKFKDRYTPREAFQMLENAETLKAWVTACERIKDACED